jgi:hypothetical protein
MWIVLVSEAGRGAEGPSNGRGESGSKERAFALGRPRNRRLVK